MAKDKHRLLVTVGLPRSGKTTWARSIGAPVVNPDSIRLALHGQRFQALAEPFVWAAAQLMVRALFLAGHATVIIDATNTTQKRRAIWLSDEWDTFFAPITASRDVCIQRAEAIGDIEIIPVINRMADQFEPLTDEERKDA